MDANVASTRYRLSLGWPGIGRKIGPCARRTTPALNRTAPMTQR